MTELAIVLSRGLGIGAVYSLVAMSMIVIFNASNIINFAQGAWVVLAGALAAYFLPKSPSVESYLLYLLIVVVIVVVLMTLQGLITVLPLAEGEDQDSWLVTTLAASVIIGSVIERINGPDALHIPSVFSEVTLFGVRTSIAYFAAIVLALLVYVGLTLFYRKTSRGLAMEALHQDYDVARANGITARTLQIAAFAIAGVILALTGFMAGPVLALSPSTGLSLAISAFTALVVGGLGSLRGALIAGPVFGVATQASNIWIGPDFQGTVVLVLLVAVILIAPQGIFGRPSARKV